MNQLFKLLRNALHDLVHGQANPSQRKRVITVDIQRHLQENQSPQESNQNPVNEVVHVNKTTENIVILPFEEPQLLSEFTKSNRDVVYKYILKRLTKAIKYNMDGITVFQFKTSNKVANINREKYEIQLNDMMSWFVQTEDYESAATCRDLLQQLIHSNPVDQSM